MHRGPSPETTPLLRRNFCLMCAGFAATRPPAAVSLSHLASAVSIARNVQSTLPIQLVASTQNAEAPAVGCGGRVGRKRFGGILLACCLVTLMAGETSMWGNRGATLPTSSHDGRPARGGCSLSEGNRHARRGGLNQKAGCPEAPPNLTRTCTGRGHPCR